MAGEALYYGTGRRKNAVARVRLVPGTGKVTINGREALQYFGREALVNYALTPFKVTDTMDHFD
ncbi:30S ribosomal protein S9, partial [Odoribacter splanchnicus]|nr:30S ribosomal protein S9 [Odoribacter splanchnicus]